MSFLKNLFGFRLSAPATPAASAIMEYEGYFIEATPLTEGREFQVAGTIRREMDGEVREHRFIRVDKLPTREDAIQLIFRKGQQIIDQTGDRLFE